eukprot:CAMPEP_0117568834 /NCGR_PEP_ID=MMETSP0784-20121206/58346_1 /TAXON_ID=39447 /ORGANISM="" /LENGTH=406 /DNA_ID=CAMNT_0005366787 /DNA_START=121 /DNA_END=1339 /DNA_ORIENTATION=+
MGRKTAVHNGKAQAPNFVIHSPRVRPDLSERKPQKVCPLDSDQSGEESGPPGSSPQSDALQQVLVSGAAVTASRGLRTPPDSDDVAVQGEVSSKGVACAALATCSFLAVVCVLLLAKEFRAASRPESWRAWPSFEAMVAENESVSDELDAPVSAAFEELGLRTVTVLAGRHEGDGLCPPDCRWAAAEAFMMEALAWMCREVPVASGRSRAALAALAALTVARATAGAAPAARVTSVPGPGRRKTARAPAACATLAMAAMRSTALALRRAVLGELEALVRARGLQFQRRRQEVHVPRSEDEETLCPRLWALRAVLGAQRVLRVDVQGLRSVLPGSGGKPPLLAFGLRHQPRQAHLHVLREVHDAALRTHVWLMLLEGGRPRRTLSRLQCEPRSVGNPSKVALDCHGP